MNLRFITLAFILVISTFTLEGQTCCSAGVPLSSNIGIKPQDGKTIVLGILLDYNNLQDLYLGDERLDDDSRIRSTYTGIFRTSYAINDRLSFQGIFTYIRQVRKITGPTGNQDITALNGMGDWVLLAQYRLINSNSHGLILGGGPKIPTGKSNLSDQDNGFQYPEDLQPGSGSWDLITALSYTYTTTIRPSLMLHATSSYRYNTSKNLKRGFRKYKFGNEILVSAGITDRFLVCSLLLDPGIQFRYRKTAGDEIENNLLPNTGGDWFYFIPGVSINPSTRLNIHLNFEIPVYIKLYGIQLTTTNRFNVSFNYLFNLGKVDITIPEI
jgi:hypothetical protein